MRSLSVLALGFGLVHPAFLSAQTVAMSDLAGRWQRVEGPPDVQEVNFRVGPDSMLHITTKEKTDGPDRDFLYQWKLAGDTVWWYHSSKTAAGKDSLAKITYTKIVLENDGQQFELFGYGPSKQWATSPSWTYRRIGGSKP